MINSQEKLELWAEGNTTLCPIRKISISGLCEKSV